MPIVKRAVKGAALDIAEFDGNFDLFSSAPDAVTLSNDTATLNGAGYYVVDTQGGAASDDLSNIAGLANGDVVELVLANVSRVITVRHAIGNIRLANGQPFTLNALGDSIVFRERGGIIYERYRTSVSDS